MDLLDHILGNEINSETIFCRCDLSSTEITINWTNFTLEYNSIKNETFHVGASVSKGCEPIIQLKLYSSLDYPFEGNSNLNKCKTSTKKGNSPYKTQEKAKSFGKHFRLIETII